MIVAVHSVMPLKHTHTHISALCITIQPVCLCLRVCSSLSVVKVLSIAYMSAVLNCFSSAAPLAVLWLEIGVLTQRLEDSLYLMLASDSQ